MHFSHVAVNHAILVCRLDQLQLLAYRYSLCTDAAQLEELKHVLFNSCNRVPNRTYLQLCVPSGAADAC